MVATVAGNKNPQPSDQARGAAPMPIPFVRAARRKSIQAYTKTFTLSAGATTAVEPIELPAAGFIRDLEVYVQITSTGNAATVANPAVGDLPWNVINNLQVTNAAGDTIYVPINGYQLYLINKYSGIYQPPQCDPRADQVFTATTTGAGATAGTGAFLLRIPFEIDPRDAFCALPNLAANKAYQLLINFASIAQVWSGGTAPNGTVTVTLTIVMNYWSQPNAVNGDGYPQETTPPGVGSVSLFRFQTLANIGGGNKVFQLVNVGNVIRWGCFTLYDTSAPNVRTDAQWSPTNYFRLNNDQLYFKPLTFWLSQMRRAFGYGAAAGAKDAAGSLDTGVYVLSDFIEQHGSVEVDSPRDQFLVTLDSTLWQLEGSLFGATANNLFVLTNEIKPVSAAALYSLNIV
jgi:hypothetical protein